MLVTYTLFFINFVTMAGSYKPNLRSGFARTLYEKILNDDNLRNMDFSKMYYVDENVLSPRLRDIFVQLDMDSDTQSFIDSCFEQSDWILMQVWHSIAKSFLGMFMSQTSINGWLNRGRMFVWSTNQARKLFTQKSLTKPRLSRSINEEKRKNECVEGACALLPGAWINLREDDGASSCSVEESGISPSWWSGKKILDLGAGDGHVTRILAESAAEVYVTETSSVMRNKLMQKGYKVLEVDSWTHTPHDTTFDIITCLNLLDRCDKPKTLLREMRDKIADDGKIVIALVLPFSAYVEAASDHTPLEDLGIYGDSVESQVNHFAEEVLPAEGLRLTNWSKLPYLCEGDMEQAFYWLSDVIFIVEKEN